MPAKLKDDIISVDHNDIKEIAKFIKNKKFHSIFLFIIDTHRPLIGTISQVMLAFSFLPMIFGYRNLWLKILTIASDPEMINFFYEQLNSDNSYE